MPMFVSGPDPIMACSYDMEIGITLADLVYSIDVPGGSCVDHGRSCDYRNPDIHMTNDGIRHFRVQYASRTHRNRVWLASYGDFSAATQAKMLILIKIDGGARASLEDEFVPYHNGGWISR
jgi:hypothetical protein